MDFVRKIHQRVSVLFMHRKLAERPAKSLCLALLLKHVLGEISGKVQFSTIHQKFSLKLLEQDLPAVDIFDEFLREVEQLDVILAATSASLTHSSGDKGKIKSGASSAPSVRVKQDGGGSRAAGSGKGGNSGNKGGAGKPNKPRDGSTKPSVSTVAADGGNDDSVVT